MRRIFSDDLLTSAEAAKLLKVSRVTLQRWLKEGRLASYNLGPRSVRIRRKDLERLLTPVTREELHAPDWNPIRAGAPKR